MYTMKIIHLSLPEKINGCFLVSVNVFKACSICLYFMFFNDVVC